MCKKLPILIPKRRREKGTRENGIRKNILPFPYFI